MAQACGLGTICKPPPTEGDDSEAPTATPMGPAERSSGSFQRVVTAVEMRGDYSCTGLGPNNSLPEVYGHEDYKSCIAAVDGELYAQNNFYISGCEYGVRNILTAIPSLSSLNTTQMVLEYFTYISVQGVLEYWAIIPQVSSSFQVCFHVYLGLSDPVTSTKQMFSQIGLYPTFWHVNGLDYCCGPNHSMTEYAGTPFQTPMYLATVPTPTSNPFMRPWTCMDHSAGKFNVPNLKVPLWPQDNPTQACGQE